VPGRGLYCVPAMFHYQRPEKSEGIPWTRMS
jgi:hypothetical protein